MMYLWGRERPGKSVQIRRLGFLISTPFTKTGGDLADHYGCGMPGGLLSLSANGNTNGIVWASCVYTGDAVHDIVPGILRAYDANDLGTELWKQPSEQIA